MGVSKYPFRTQNESLWSVLYLLGLCLLFLAGFGGNAKPTWAQSSSGPTNISIGTTVKTPNVKRLGINLSGYTNYDSGQEMRNLTMQNFGFEPQVWQSVFKCTAVSGHTCADGNIYSLLPANFMKGASFEFVYGQANGQTGTLLSSTAASYSTNSPVWYNFGTASPAVGDVFILRQPNPPGQTPSDGWWPGTSGGATITADTTDLSPNTRGHQAASLNASGSGQSATENNYFDGFPGRSFLQLNGSYTLYFRAKSTGGSNQLNVSVTRIGTPLHGNVTYLNKAVSLTNSWQDYSYTFTASEDGTYVGTVGISFSVNGGSLYLDDAYLEEAANPDNPTAYRNAVVDRLKQLNPGVIRYMDNGIDFGSPIDNMLAPDTARVRAGFGQANGVQTQIPVGLEDFLVLCQTVGAEPWYTMPSAMSPTEMQNLIEFLGGSSSTPYGAKRAALGQTAPWTSVFSSIHLELGNEIWNSISFTGESYGDPYSYGSRVGTIFGAAKASSSYSSKIDLIADGFAVSPWWNQQVMTAANGNYDTLDVAPYTFYTLNDYSSNEAIYGSMFAEPESLDSIPSGYMYQQAQAAATAAKPANLAVYEVNLSTVSGTAPQATVNAVVPSVGAGISVAEHMLLMMRDDGVVTQNMFALPEYINGFNNTNVANENVRLWGTVIDMGGQSNLCRPQFLAVQLANTAIFGDLLATTVSGNNPTWNVNSTNGPIVMNGAHYIQSFAFSNGSQNSVVLFNLSRSTALPVTFSGANAPSGTVQVGRLTSANLTDNNENSSVVATTTSTLTNFSPSSGVTLPPYSMTVYTWSAGSSATAAANTTTTLTATPTAVTTGQTVTLKATVAATNNSGTPAGSVTFYDGSTSLGSATLSGGVATVTDSTLPAGSNSITAVYAGDSSDNGSTSSAVTVTVTGSAPSTIATTTTLQAPATVTQGQSITLTAKVSPASGSSPTGSVAFRLGSTTLGTVQLSGGTASYTGTINLSPGQYSAVASYAGSSTDGASSSAASTVTIQAVPAVTTTTTLSSSTTHLTNGARSTVDVSVKAASGAVPTGSVSLYIGTYLVTTLQLSNGSASFQPTVAMEPGTYQLVAKYAGDTTDNASASAPLTFIVTATTAVNLTSGATQVVEGSPVALTASVTPQFGDVTATGAVTFYLGQTALGSLQLANGQVTADPAINLPPGQYVLTAAYGGDSNDDGATSNALNLTVTAPIVAAISTNTTLTATPKQLTQGQTMQLAALVTAASGSTPTGSVSFYLGQTQLGMASLTSGTANATVSATMAPGTYQLTAVYAGTSQDSASSSAPVAITIAPSVVATTTTLVSSASQLIQGQPFSLSATVAPTDSSNAQGNVNFFLGQTQLGSASLSGNQAVWSGPASFVPGSYQLTAVYTGNAQDSVSTSAPLTLVIVAATVTTPPAQSFLTNTMLTVNPQQVTAGQTVSLSVQVAEQSGSSVPGGAVTFYLGQTQVGTGMLTNGTAAASLTAPAAGTYTLTASYAGQGQDLASASQAVTLTVQAAPATVPTAPTPTQAPTFTLGLSDTKINLSGGQSATLQVLLSAVQGYQGSVQLSCSGLPAGVSCNFSPSNVTLQAASANSTLSLSAATSVTAKLPMVTNLTRAMILPWDLLGLFGLFSGRKRLKYRFGNLVLLLLVLSGGLIAMTGCGLSINHSTVPYQVSVTAVGANQQSQTQSFTLYVTGPDAGF